MKILDFKIIDRSVVTINKVLLKNNYRSIVIPGCSIPKITDLRQMRDFLLDCRIDSFITIIRSNLWKN